MKRSVKICSLVLVMILTTMMLASCSPIDAILGIFAGTPDEDPESALNDLLHYPFAEYSGNGTQQLDGSIHVWASEYDEEDYSHTDPLERIDIYYFSSEADAKAAYEKKVAETEAEIALLEETIEAMESMDASDEDIEAAEDELDKLEDLIIDYDGTIFWFSTCNLLILIAN